MFTLTLASTDDLLVRELQDSLDFNHIRTNEPIEIDSLPMGLPIPEEKGSSIIRDAFLKAEFYGTVLNRPVLADSTSFHIHALDDRPGMDVHSWGRLTHETVPDKILRSLLGQYSRTAHIETAMCCFSPNDNAVYLVRNRINGYISLINMDPDSDDYRGVFIPNGASSKTLSEMDRQQVSDPHCSSRTSAFKAILERMKKTL